jgi:hypothetical protein
MNFYFHEFFRLLWRTAQFRFPKAPALGFGLSPGPMGRCHRTV